MRTSARTRYAGYRFPAEIIGHAVWLYFRFPLGLRMVRRGIVKGRQLCRGAPWVIKAEDLAAYREKPSRRPLTSDPSQQSLQFQ